ncbi:MAG: bifunctional 4-hydroxy-2-oxoglutarate aldolase/2-dehydro-3-deoxy-phosphogluconate aldolase [Candidatus Aureabacteria bacterium]|nr:bifunctional 4-hydroxy-2-oxoglutarate aldolase/2-dehydro-3-deoxy-phosphogluconate aldolase [Candidatus Auribacterota bacterium]
MNLKEFNRLPLLGILRGIKKEVIHPLADSIIASGLKSVEITLNTEGAPELIKEMVRYSRGRLMIGAGTVLNRKDLKQALNAGATFIVMPVLDKEVVNDCVKHDIPVFPGALTPKEIYDAWNCGATMVKIFPSNSFGPQYFKEIKAPLQDVKLLACGGVTPQNIRDFFTCGASAAAFGASVFNKEWLAEKKFSLICEVIKKLIQAYIK